VGDPAGDLLGRKHAEDEEPMPLAEGFEVFSKMVSFNNKQALSRISVNGFSERPMKGHSHACLQYMVQYCDHNDRSGDLHPRNSMPCGHLSNIPPTFWNGISFTLQR
jgi:hypothetical protein